MPLTPAPVYVLHMKAALSKNWQAAACLENGRINALLSWRIADISAVVNRSL
jgi:hypothetical protein